MFPGDPGGGQNAHLVLGGIKSATPPGESEISSQEQVNLSWGRSPVAARTRQPPRSVLIKAIPEARRGKANSKKRVKINSPKGYRKLKGDYDYSQKFASLTSQT